MRERRVFISGATGYVGRRLIPELLCRGHRVRALIRTGSNKPLPEACEVVAGDALKSETFARVVPPADTFIHLVGVPRPAPWKGAQFQAVDLPALRASLAAAREANIRHLVYVSVAQPAPVMKAYIRVRAECETLIRTTSLSATILRPWYILGPGHYWPMALLPLYAVLKHLPGTHEAAERLGLLTIQQMVAALVWAIEHPAEGIRVIEVPGIRRLASA
jgi:uncharacterized protein YbjT (DUF2867 family)